MPCQLINTDRCADSKYCIYIYLNITPPLTIQLIHSFTKWKIFWPLVGANYLSCSVTLRDIQSTLRDIQSTLRDIQPAHLRLLIYSRWYNSKRWIEKNLEGTGTGLIKVLYQDWHESKEEDHERRNHNIKLSYQNVIWAPLIQVQTNVSTIPMVILLLTAPRL
jgi:hypothetical protein